MEKHVLNDSFRNEPAATNLSTRQEIQMLDVKYERADLPLIIQETRNHLKVTKTQKLPKLLQEFEEFFDGTLGEWKTSPAKLEMKPGELPVYGSA